jgi:hypothetical protein
MRTFLGAVPLSAFALVIAIVVALVLSPAVGGRLRTRRSVAALLLFGFGLVFAATLVPTGAALEGAALEGAASDGVCDVSRLGLAPIEELTNVTFTSLNVLLFVPLGVAVGLLPRTRAAAAVTVLAISTTFLVEAIQFVVTVLGRGCQTADMVDNLLGLAIGIALGTLARPLVAVLPGWRAR